MKKMLITLLVIFIVFVAFQSFMAISTSKIEKQPYRVVKKESDFEVRFYPPATFATIRSSAKKLQGTFRQWLQKNRRLYFWQQ